MLRLDWDEASFPFAGGTTIFVPDMKLQDNTILYLSTCDTCRRILKEIAPEQHALAIRDIKHEPLSTDEIAWLEKKTGTFESLINKGARLFKGTDVASLTEEDYSRLLAEDYTYMKRPLYIIGGKVFAGNDHKTVESVLEAIKGQQTN